MSMVLEGEIKARGRSITSLGAEESSVDVKTARSFWRAVERIQPGASISSGPAGRERTIVVVSGWVSETRILPDGRRQIFSFLLPGDVAAMTHASNIGNRGLVALTNVEIADAGALGGGEAGEGPGAWLTDASRRREERLFEQIVRIGRLSAKERVLNLLLELYDRLDAIGLVKESAFRIPLTQEVFADALGLSVVHINRTLQQLRREGMVTMGRGTVMLHDRQRLASFACYQAEIHHGGFDQSRRASAARSN
ncbi:Crp/Fnr family transcriptional regulator [Phenylobacterium sp. LjRoot225]